VIESASNSSIRDQAQPGFSQLNAIMQGKKKGKTRAEAFAELDIKPVEILPGGELKLPSGKVIGHRDYKYIYR